MKKVEVGVRVDRAVEDVYAYATSVDTMAEWRGDISEAEQLTAGAIGEGTRIRGGGRAFGRPIGMVIEVTALEPGAKFAYKGGAGPLRTHNIYTFESEAGGTRVTLTDEIELRGIFGLFEPVMGRVVRRQYKANLGRLKAVLEAQAPKGA